jgi:aspartate carbamoyltransferase catalytic subunit
MKKQEVWDMIERADQMRRPLRHYPHKTVVHYGDISHSNSLLGFKAASIQLGCRTLTANVSTESLEDSVHTLQYYGDVLVMSHNRPDAISCALNISQIPVIQGGMHSNLSQALADIYTLFKELRFREIQLDSEDRDPLHVTFLGYSRTVQPFVKLLELFPKIECHYTQKDVPPETDVLYVSRQQGPEDYRIDRAFLQTTKPKLILMHPFPRTDELSIEADTNPRSVYFRQIENGHYMRMAILDKVLSMTCSPTLWEWLWILGYAMLNYMAKLKTIFSLRPVNNSSV